MKIQKMNGLFRVTVAMAGVDVCAPKSGLPASSVEICQRKLGLVGSVMSSA